MNCLCCCGIVVVQSTITLVRTNRIANTSYSTRGDFTVSQQSDSPTMCSPELPQAYACDGSDVSLKSLHRLDTRAIALALLSQSRVGFVKVYFLELGLVLRFEKYTLPNYSHDRGVPSTP